MFSQAAFLVAMVAFACCVLLTIHALLEGGLSGIKRHKKSLYLTFSLYVLAFTLFLVTQSPD
ncbi:MAG: hypothetical protein UDG94_10310 [Peptococcaceae bacterium]|nr:hypothetical protein [Peptococcaceae bacterium]